MKLESLGESENGVTETGESADPGSFACVECSFPVSLDHPGELPTCPNCGGESFRRASLFEAHTRGFEAVAQAPEPDGWLDDARESAAPGKHVAVYAGGRGRLFELGEGWSRIGRSGSADIRLDDPTVSRRHAVIVRTPEGELSALDDRSTNGIAVNGTSVDWSPLADGDSVQIGRYTLHVIDSTD